jgi:thiol-disulfide isomerase/thioredoxin
MGVVMVVVAILLAAMVDVRFQTAIANELPGFLLSPADKLQRGAPDKSKLYRRAPEFTDNQRWFNTAHGAPLTMAGLRGRVVLVDFWTYTCINCIRTFPHLKALDAKYRRDGLTVVGVHSPEFPFERKASNVAAAIRQNGLRYPVAQDNDLGTWNAWGNQYWPADYLVDARGRVRLAHFGEGGYEETERAVRKLLAEAGRRRLGGMTHPRIETASPNLQTPETYLGEKRSQGFVNGPLTPGARDFGTRVPRLPRNGFAFAGRWNVGEESAIAGPGARLGARFIAKKVFLVLGSPGHARRMRVLLDGRPIRTVTVNAQRLYRLVSLPRVGEHLLTLEPEPGIAGYAFTFG